jgi:Dolichyl-phosphate-mannose-protein mannosyltransferase
MMVKMTKKQLLLRYILPFSLGLGIFIFIVMKAAIVQITVDEAYTLTILTKESVWDLVSYKESYTNNHILHSLLCKLSFAVFGMEQVAGRLPNLLSFLLYFGFVWRYSRRFFTDDLVSFMFVTVMVGNPYLLDFFSLARGYGLSISLMMASIYFAARYILEDNKRSLPLSQLFAILSVYAQFALLHFYLGLNFLIFLFLIQKHIKTKNWAEILRGCTSLIVSLFSLGILVYTPFKTILKDNQISYYGSNNIWDDTFVSLTKNSLYWQGYFSENTILVFKNLMI